MRLKRVFAGFLGLALLAGPVSAQPQPGQGAAPTAALNAVARALQAGGAPAFRLATESEAQR